MRVASKKTADKLIRLSRKYANTLDIMEVVNNE